MRFTLFLFLSVCISFSANAQVDSRSGYPSPKESRSALRTFPCGGETLFHEQMSADSIPAGWQTLDLDMQPLAPQVAGIFQTGWQSLKDFKDDNNRVLGSPSWYADSSQASDDWLITPMISLDTNTCLSWYAYSQDRFFPESYEVRISTEMPTPDSMGFLANDPLMVVEAEQYELNYRSVNLSEYDGMDVYIAFRHTSIDAFMLVLDDVRLGKVKAQDIGAVEIVDIDIEPGDSVLIKAAIINYGSDTLSFDSVNSVTLNYNIDNGGSFVYSFPPTNDSVLLAPNDTVQFSHSEYWKPTTAQPYYICVWTEWMLDGDASNDTTCIRVGVGIDITSVEDVDQGIPVRIYPNPATERVSLDWDKPVSMRVEIFDLMGKKALPSRETEPGSRSATVETGSLPSGIYLLKLTTPDGRTQSKKWVKQ